MMRFLAAALVLATAVSCGASSSSPTCTSLDESQCIVSGKCTLVPARDTPADYQCIDARNVCEEGFLQRDGSAESCEQTDGCRFEPANCYCAPDLTCICGGGPPSQCVPASS